MAARKRKSPDRRKPAAAPGLPLRALLAAGTILGRHPKPVLGIAAFGVLFSFVAANALWYQPEGHPAPFWATRDPNDPNAMPGFRRIHHDVAADVTTFRIERASDNPQLANAQTQVSQAQPAGQPNIAQSTASGTSSGAQAASQLGAHNSGPYAPIQPVAAGDPVYAAGSHELVAAVQAELARRGLYDGATDGLAGSRTSKAILTYQQKMGFDSTGEATPELLAALQSQSRAQGLPALTAPVAAQNQPAGLDPVAQAIADASGQSTGTAAFAQSPQARSNTVALPTPRPAPAELGANTRAQSQNQNNQRAAPQPATAQPATLQPASLPLRQAMPATRPRENVALRSDDPVAAAIRAQSHGANVTPPADIPVGSVRPNAARQAVSAPPLHAVAATRVSAPATAPAADLVLQIQRGLSNIAYADVRVSGYADRDTKEAIRRFERHYRLPETGEPNPMVLQKLRAIGAL